MTTSRKKIPSSIIPRVIREAKEQQAHYVCLLTPINDNVAGTTVQIETLITFLENSKNEMSFRETLSILKDQVSNQVKMITHLSEIVATMERVYSQTESKDDPEGGAKIH